MSRSFTIDIAGASPSHQDAAGIMGGYTEGPNRWFSPDVRISRHVSDLDVKANVEAGFEPVLLSVLEAGSEVQPTQSPHPLLELEKLSGYLDVSRTTMGIISRQTADIGDIRSQARLREKSEILHYYLQLVS